MRNPNSERPADDPAALLRAADAAVTRLEARLRGEDASLADVLVPSIDTVAEAMRAALAAAGKPLPARDADVLDVWQALVKGEPTWNAIRDNCRELVYYRNCIAAGRSDALPPAPAQMAVRTARHVLLYIRTRALREGWAPDA
jgi:hypothetical protein